MRHIDSVAATRLAAYAHGPDDLKQAMRALGILAYEQREKLPICEDAAGTYTGLSRHRYRNDPPCPVCLKARSVYASHWLFKKGVQQRPAQCPRCSSMFKAEHRCSMDRTAR